VIQHASLPFAFRDFERAKDVLRAAVCDHHESYVLLTGDTGTGKTALLRQLRGEIDRARFRILYFSQSRRLGAAGLVKVVGESLRARISMCHSVSFDRLQRALADQPQILLLWLDEAHALPEETRDEVQALVESDLEGERRVQVLFAGMPRLRAELQSHGHLWRRIVVREEITGLVLDELAGFLDHHFPSEQEGSGRLCERGLSALFERAKGAPGLILPMHRATLARAGRGKGKIDIAVVEGALERWDLE
jgi:MSHA biogenesis protein MshM